MSATQPRLLAGQLVAERFQIACFLGAGEMGEAYDVRDSTNGYAYALKLYDPQLTQVPGAWDRLQQEAQRAASIAPELAAAAYAFAFEPQIGCPFVLGELMPIPSLQALVSTQGPLSITAVAAILRAVAPGLDKLHAAGVVHRALKPQNLFVAQSDADNWQARITDFGAGAVRPLAPPPPGWTATPGWLPAEQADPATEPSPAMDLYTLALLAFFALTGRSYFLACRQQPVDLNLLWAELTSPPAPASQRATELGALLSPTLDPWFAKAMSLGAAQRFASAGEMAMAFGSLVSAEPQPTAAPVQVPMAPAQNLAPAQPAGIEAVSMTPPQAQPFKKTKLLIPVAIGGALALVTVIAMAGWMLAGSSSPDPKPAATATPTQSASAVASASASAEDPTPAAPTAQASANEQPDAAPPEPTDALVRFECKPECEAIKCDGEDVQDPASGVRLEAGKHTCVGSRKGYVSRTDTFVVKAGEDMTRSVYLARQGPAPVRPPSPARTCGTFLNPCK